MLAFCFGAGAALTLDEFALVLPLEDVYWTGEGRKSIDAMILGVTFMPLLLTGLLPRTFNELGDFITLSRWVLTALIIVVGAAFVVVCYLKGKLFAGSGYSCRRLRSSGRSAWPSRGHRGRAGRIARDAETMERARRRDDSRHQLWEHRERAVSDVIGGSDLAALRRGATAARRDHGRSPKGDWRESHV